MTVQTISGDVRSPDEAQTFMYAAAAGAEQTAISIEQSRVNLSAEGITGAPIELLAGMHAAATSFAAACRAAAAQYEGHVTARGEYVTGELAGTQAGRYLDPAAQ